MSDCDGGGNGATSKNCGVGGGGGGGSSSSSKDASSTYNNEPECTVGEQLFLSNPSRSNENLIDSTAGSCDPLFANQSLEQINLGKLIPLSTLVLLFFFRFLLISSKIALMNAITSRTAITQQNF